jgi:hypothetical protein
MAVKRKPRAQGGKKKEQSKTGFASVFSQLRGVMKAYDSLYSVKTDQPKRSYLETKDGRYKGNPMMFGAVMLGKCVRKLSPVSAVCLPGTQENSSQGINEAHAREDLFQFDLLFKQLSDLTAASHEAFSKKKWPAGN